MCPTAARNLIIDTDIFSDVDDTGALLLAATSPKVNLLAVNINVGSTYSALAASAILAHYGKGDVPIGIVRPLANSSFFDDYAYELGDRVPLRLFFFFFIQCFFFASTQPTLAAHQRRESRRSRILYRSTLASAPDGSVTIASIGFFENLSSLLNSTADPSSPLNGTELVRCKVERLVVMGGMYPRRPRVQLLRRRPRARGARRQQLARADARRVLGRGAGRQRHVGDAADDAGGEGWAREGSGGQAYRWYTYGAPRPSWDPLTVLFTMDGGVGELFEYGNEFGYNHVFPNGSNAWVYDEAVTDQRFLKLRVSNETAAAELDRLYLAGANSANKGF
ncbi:hypothetical protein PG994_002283 [Apiospora phragmitis]|uniref:Inosine/uridine-preferring nucleoside hydrolase domain-containing protein n=1 Tax=Apiospora phragmitis TaxID=2905665 RepID=A0ABR1WVW3_9PEZI